MKLDEFLNLLATIFGTLGAIYVMLGILSMSPELLEQQTHSYWAFSTPKLESLARQKAESISGAVFIIIAFTLAFINIMFVPQNIEVFKSKIVALASALFLAGGVYVTLFFITSGIYKNQKLTMGKIITSRYVDKIIEKGSVDLSDAKSLPTYAEELLGLKVPQQQTTKELILQIGEVINKKIPETLDFSKLSSEETKEKPDK